MNIESYENRIRLLEEKNQSLQNEIEEIKKIINSTKKTEIEENLISTNISGNMKFELIEPNSSYDLSQSENISTKFIILLPKLTPFELLRSINNSEKIFDINHNIKILDNGEKINVLKCTPLIYMNVSGKWNNILIDYVEYILKAYNKLTNAEMEMIKQLWG